MGLIAAWIRGPFARDATLDPGPALGDLCDRPGWPTFAAALEDAFADTSRETIGRNVRLLADGIAGEGTKPGRRPLCGSLATSLLTSLESRRDPDAPRDGKPHADDRVQVLATLARIMIDLGTRRGSIGWRRSSSTRRPAGKS